MVEISRQAGSWPPGVPTFVLGNQVMVGFDDAEHMGGELVAWLGEPAKARETVESSIFGTLRASELGLPVFTLAIGLLDGALLLGVHEAESPAVAVALARRLSGVEEGGKP